MYGALRFPISLSLSLSLYLKFVFFCALLHEKTLNDDEYEIKMFYMSRCEAYLLIGFLRRLSTANMTFICARVRK